MKYVLATLFAHVLNWSLPVLSTLGYADFLPPYPWGDVTLDIIGEIFAIVDSAIICVVVWLVNEDV